MSSTLVRVGVRNRTLPACRWFVRRASVGEGDFDRERFTGKECGLRGQDGHPDSRVCVRLIVLLHDIQDRLEAVGFDREESVGGLAFPVRRSTVLLQYSGRCRNDTTLLQAEISAQRYGTNAKRRYLLRRRKRTLLSLLTM